MDCPKSRTLKTNPPMPDESRFKLEVSIRKTNQSTGCVEHEASVSSNNLTLAETIQMQEPLLQVLGGWVKEDAE